MDHSGWATPIVVIPKKDNSVSICGDFKVTVNPNLQIDQYPLPKIDDIFANLSGRKRLTKLDLRTAYMQIEMEDESKEYLTINTHRGLFRYNRRPNADVDSGMRKNIQSRKRTHAVRQCTDTFRSESPVATFVRCLTIRPRGRTLSCVSVGRGETDSVWFL